MATARIRARPGTAPAERRGGWRAVEPPRQPVLFVNPRSCGGRAARAEVAEKARALGVSCVVLERGQDLAALAQEAIASGADALGLVGGDGSLAVVAAAASAQGIRFVRVPAGTRNHFALDLGVARHDVAGALGAFTDGLERAVDVAVVNGRVFVNNVSFGVYGESVQRPGYRTAKGRGLLDTAQHLLGPSAPAPRLRVVDDLGREHANPVVLLVSNNPYAVGHGVVRGSRPRLDSGRLGMVALDEPPGAPHRAGHAWSGATVEIAADAALHAGVDGEAVTLDPPLHVASRPGALRARISRRHPGLSPSAVDRGSRRPAGPEAMTR
jgi:diacylglycerol kinase family enzyme